MEFTCKLCDKVFDSKKGLHIHVSRTHKLTIPEYYVEVFQRKDRYSGELLPFKDFTDYFSREFSTIENFKLWAESANPHEVREVMLRQLKARIAGKELKYGPSYLELKTNGLPTINMFKRFFGSYSNACNELNVEPLYNKGLVNNFFDKNSELKDIKILIDTREQKPLSFPRSMSMKLDFGDYAVGAPHYDYTYVDRKDENDFRTTMTSGFDRFTRELERARDFDAFLFVVVEGSIESIIKNNNLIPKKANVPFIWHNMRLLMHRFPRRCQFIFTGDAEKGLFNKLDSNFYNDFDKLQAHSKSLQDAGNEEEFKKINNKLWILKKNIFKPAYEAYALQARKMSELIIPKLLVFGQKLWNTDLQYFIDEDDLGKRNA